MRQGWQKHYGSANGLALPASETVLAQVTVLPGNRLQGGYGNFSRFLKASPNLPHTCDMAFRRRIRSTP